MSVSHRKMSELQEKGSRAEGGERPLSPSHFLPRAGQNMGLSGELRLVRRGAGARVWG